MDRFHGLKSISGEVVVRLLKVVGKVSKLVALNFFIKLGSMVNFEAIVTPRQFNIL